MHGIWIVVTRVCVSIPHELIRTVHHKAAAPCVTLHELSLIAMPVVVAFLRRIFRCAWVILFGAVIAFARIRRCNVSVLMCCRCIRFSIIGITRIYIFKKLCSSNLSVLCIHAIKDDHLCGLCTSYNTILAGSTASTHESRTGSLCNRPDTSSRSQDRQASMCLRSGTDSHCTDPVVSVVSWKRNKNSQGC